MDSVNVLSENLVEMLSHLQKSAEFSVVSDELFKFNFSDFDKVFEISKMDVQNETYKRLPVFQGDHCVAILMIWGIDNKTAIHDHKNYDGRIKILKGSLTEVSYRENSNFIEYDGVATAFENQDFPEEYGGIHSIVNNSEEISVSLHIYRTSQLNLEGVRIFDTVHRKIALLNRAADSCSWNLPTENYEKIWSV